MRILVFGASMERGYRDLEGGWVRMLQKELDRLTWNRDIDRSVYNLGVSGDTSEDIRKRVGSEIEARDNGEELVAILRVTGLNDSLMDRETGESQVSLEEYRKNLESILEIASGSCNSVHLVGQTPIDQREVDPVPWKETHSYRTERYIRYRDVLNEVRESREIGFSNLRARIDEETWRRNYLEDGIHPNREGHRKIYDLVKKDLKSRGTIPD